MPKVSIIVIIYKVERFLEQCLKSITDQTYQNLEIICVVGKGDTACEEICDRTAAADARVLVLKEEPKGSAAARNQGLDAATGDYIGFVDGDDYIAADMIETMVNAAAETQADISVVGKYYQYENGAEGTDENETHIMNVVQAFEMILYQEGFFLHLWDKLYRKELFDNVRFPVGQLVEDRQIACRILSQANRVVYNTASKYYFRVSADSGSRVEQNLMLSLKADYEICDFLHKKYPELEEAIAFFLVNENMSVIQNSMLFGSFSKSHDREYLAYVKAHEAQVKKNPRVPRRLKIKMDLCTKFPGLFYKVTCYRRKKFLKKHVSCHSGTNWTDTFKKQGI